MEVGFIVAAQDRRLPPGSAVQCRDALPKPGAASDAEAPLQRVVEGVLPPARHDVSVTIAFGCAPVRGAQNSTIVATDPSPNVRSQKLSPEFCLAPEPRGRRIGIGTTNRTIDPIPDLELDPRIMRIRLHRFAPFARGAQRTYLCTLCTEAVDTSPRLRRKGARVGALSPELRDAVRSEAARIADLEDPITVIKTTGDAFAALDSELERIADVRLAAIRRLREEGWSYDRIAAATGLSKTRVAKLSREA